MPVEGAPDIHAAIFSSPTTALTGAEPLAPARLKYEWFVRTTGVALSVVAL